LRREFNLPAATAGAAKELVLPVDVYLAACQRAEELTGDPFLGLHVALDPRSAGSIRIFSELAVLKIEFAATRAVVTHYVPGEPLGTGRHGNEHWLATVVRLLREVTQTMVLPVEVGLAHPAPNDVSELEAFFGTTALRFGRRENRLVFDVPEFTVPVSVRDGMFFGVFDEQTAFLRPQRDMLALELKEHLKDLLRGGKATTVTAASRRLGVTARTLQRRLGESSTSFLAQLDEVRRELAGDYVGDLERSLDEVAVLVGYAQKPAFERAFRRW
jgi:AraC-like DNA-binding protein